MLIAVRVLLVFLVIVLTLAAIVCSPETESISYPVSVERWDTGEPRRVQYEIATVESIGYGRYRVFGEPLHYVRPEGELEAETPTDLRYKDGRRIRYRTDFTRLTAICSLIVAVGLFAYALTATLKSRSAGTE